MPKRIVKSKGFFSGYLQHLNGISSFSFFTKKKKNTNIFACFKSIAVKVHGSCDSTNFGMETPVTHLQLFWMKKGGILYLQI